MSQRIERNPQFALKPLALAIALAAGNLAHAAPIAEGMIPTISTGNIPTANIAQHGNVTLALPNANTLNINQATPKAVIDWQRFQIDAGNTVNFNQPSATATALNRIHQIDPSVIAGALNANGRVYLVNQNGIIFSGTARINTGGLLASSLDIDEDQFVNSSIFAAIRDGNPALYKELEGLPDAEKLKFLASKIQIDPGAELKLLLAAAF